MSSKWPEILNEIASFQTTAKREGNLVWYRGHRCAAWPLKSTVHRRVDDSLAAVKQSLPESDRIDLMRDFSKTLFQKFRARGWQLLGAQERSDWGIVFAMQHYGVPTRLIDWTESFVCALYFAQLQRAPADDAAIFVLDPQRLNLATIQKEGLVALGGDVKLTATVNTTSYHPAVLADGKDMEAIAVAPVLTHPRMVAQRACFVLSGVSFQPLEERYSKCIKKILLPANTFDEAEQFLDMTGQGHFGYFPDLDGLRVQLLTEMDREVINSQRLLRQRAE